MRIIDDAAVGPYERVVHAEDREAGMHAIVALHSTALGPAIGGTRFYPYRSTASAVIDVLRLAEGMTLKAAAAGLRIGGGKAVIVGEPERLRGPALWRAYAGLLDLLDGRYLTAQDVGTTVADMAEVRRWTPHVLGLPNAAGWDGDPSPFTARGVLAAMRAARDDETGSPSLVDVRVVVVGVGKVGGALARLLAAEGARVWVSDVAGERAAALAGEIGAQALDPAAAQAFPCDILAPCALGGVISPRSVDSLRCGWVIGAANNQLSDPSVADRLATRGIGYVPDFIANAGGLICIAEGLNGWTAERAGAAVDRIGDTVGELIDIARSEGETLLAAARQRAAGRLGLAMATG